MAFDLQTVNQAIDYGKSIKGELDKAAKSNIPVMSQIAGFLSALIGIAEFVVTIIEDPAKKAAEVAKGAGEKVKEFAEEKIIAPVAEALNPSAAAPSK